MFKIDMNSVSSAISDVNKLISDNERNSQKQFDFRSFMASNHPHRLAAVDGSNNNVRGVNFVFTALRTGYHIYEKGKVVKSDIDPIKVEFMMNNEDPQVGFEHKHERYYKRITGSKPNGKMEFEKSVERIRTLLEWEKVSRLIDDLSENDVIVFDGSLMSGEISTNHDFFTDLCAKAQAKGVSLVGLSKDSSLSIDSAPLISVLKDASKISHPDKNWYVEYNSSYFVKFSKFTDLVFRVDAVVADNIDFDTLISWVASYCFDYGTFGYQFPMQQIHDSVRVSELERDYCLDVFKQSCAKNGISRTVIDRMFAIYHNQLDIISYGR